MGFPCGSAGKESACKAEDLGSIPGLKGMATHSSTLAGEFYGLQSPWGHKESEWLSDFHSPTVVIQALDAP